MKAARLEQLLDLHDVGDRPALPTQRQPRPQHLAERFRKPSTRPLAVRTQDEVAAILGVSRWYVNEVEQQALRKLRAEIERRASLAGVTVNEWMER